MHHFFGLFFDIPKYAREAAGSRFSVLPCIRKELPVAGPVDAGIKVRM